MSANDILRNPGPRFVRVTSKFAIVALIFLIIGVGAMAYVIAKASTWAYASYNQWRDQRPDGVLIANPLTKIKDYFKPSSSPTTERVKVVSEESQVIDVVKKASPAVVSIIASEEVPKLEQCYQDIDQGLPREFNNFFDLRVPALCQNGTEIVRVGAGSGFLVSADGYMVTNKHVVEKEKAEYTVVLNDEKNWGKKIKAKVVARDPNNDIAILKIEMKDLPYLNFSDSDRLQVGQTAIAIGYALGQFDNTVSKGVVSGLYRSISAVGGANGVEQLRGLIQTDAAINPGNSGGPLLDIDGNVIGVNVATAEAQSIGFAIPANAVRVGFEEVKLTGRILVRQRPFIGVRYQPVTETVQAEKKLPYNYGVLVVRGPNNEPAVIAGSPAEKVGLKEGDIILEANGKQLSERYLLSDFVAGREAGDEVELKVYRDGRTISIRVRLEASKDQ